MIINIAINTEKTTSVCALLSASVGTAVVAGIVVFGVGAGVGGIVTLKSVFVEFLKNKR